MDRILEKVLANKKIVDAITRFPILLRLVHVARFPDYETFLNYLLPIEHPTSEKCSICWLPFFETDDEVFLGINKDNLQCFREMAYIAPRTVSVPNNFPVQVNCEGKHQFGLACLLDALERSGSNRCPMCRHELFAGPPRLDWGQVRTENCDTDAKYLQDELCTEISVRDIIKDELPAGTLFQVIAGEMILDLGRDIDCIAKRFTKFLDAKPHPTIQPRVHARKVFKNVHKGLIPNTFARSYDVKAVAEALRGALLKLHRQFFTQEDLKDLLLRVVTAEVPVVNRKFMKQGKWETFMKVLICFIVNKAVCCAVLTGRGTRMDRHNQAAVRGWLCDREPSRAILPPAAHIEAWWNSGRSLPAVGIYFLDHFYQPTLVKEAGRCTGPFRLLDPYDAWADRWRAYCHADDFLNHDGFGGYGRDDTSRDYFSNVFPLGVNSHISDDDEDDDDGDDDVVDVDINTAAAFISDTDESVADSEPAPTLREQINLRRDFEISDAFRHAYMRERVFRIEYIYVPGSGYWFMRDELPQSTDCHWEGNIHSHQGPDAELFVGDFWACVEHESPGRGTQLSLASPPRAPPSPSPPLPASLPLPPSPPLNDTFWG